jgi:uncharacterized protein YrrD
MAPQGSQFVIGAKASCSDGSCGEVRWLVIDPAADKVTHLVIQPGHRQEAARLVPVDLVETTWGEIRLRCTRAEFEMLDHAEERGEVDAVELPGPYVGPQPHRKVILEDVVPLGERQVRPGDRVHAVDGEIGRVRGCMVDPGDDRVTHVLLQEGHLWGHKEVAIPVGAVTGFDAGIWLSITKQQVENLPPVD